MDSPITYSLAQFKLASVWQLRGKPGRATECLLKAIDADPGYVPAYLECSVLLDSNGQREKAIQMLNLGLRKNPGEPGLVSALHRLTDRASISASAGPLLTAPMQNGKRILIYTDCSGIHGVEQNTMLLIEELLDRGYDVHYAHPGGDNFLIQKQKRIGVRHFRLGEDDIYNLKRTPRAFTAFEEPERVIGEIGPRMIFFANGCPYSNLTAQETALKRCIPYISNIHCLNEEWFEQYGMYTERLVNVLQHARKVIAVSKNNLERLQYHLRWGAKNEMVIYNGRPPAYFKEKNETVRQQVRARYNIPEEAIVSFTAARMEYVKGYHHQIEAMRELKRGHFREKLFLLWAGTGSLEARLRVMAAEAGLSDNILFLGEVDTVPDFLDASDMVILASRFEGMPLSVIEAMAKGLPVIATAVGGTPEALGDIGRLLPDPVNDPQATTSALISALRTLATDYESRQKIGKACRKRALRLFQMTDMKNAYLEQIEHVVGRKGNHVL